MIWVLGILAVLVGVPVLAALVGLTLPRDHVAQMTIPLRADPARVWGLVSDVEGSARWRSDVTAVEVQPPHDGRTRFVEVGRQGRTPFELVSQSPMTEQVVRVVDDGLLFGGTWTYALAPDGAGTRLTITEAGFIRNPLFRVMSRLFFPPTRTMDGYLRALAVELGESAAPTVDRAR